MSVRSPLNYPVTTEVISQAIASIRPSLTDMMIDEFKEDVEVYSRI